MAKKSNFFRASALTFAAQVGRMLSTYPRFSVALSRNTARWVGELQPSALSETYIVKVDYVLRSRPKVWILQPRLRPLKPDQRIKHTFSDGSVCLHLHEDWTPAMFIADTTIPWLSFWLLHYEIWHATGEWLGGGHEPRIQK
jgi:hypothetical protein